MSGKPHLYPTAAHDLDDDAEDFHRGAPPPSYEESLKMSGAAAQPNYSHAYYQQPQHSYQLSSQPQMNYVPSAPTNSYGYVNPYQAHMQQQQTYYSAASPSSSQMSPSQNVLYFHKRAEIRTTATGAITVPPPPPGCAPTPAQLAAMSGKPVAVKQKKRFFF